MSQAVFYTILKLPEAFVDEIIIGAGDDAYGNSLISIWLDNSILPFEAAGVVIVLAAGLLLMLVVGRTLLDDTAIPRSAIALPTRPSGYFPHCSRAVRAPVVIDWYPTGLLCDAEYE